MRPHFRLQVEDALEENGFFSRYDFKIRDTAERVLIEIEGSFFVYEPGNKPGTFTVRYDPSAVGGVELEICTGAKELLRAISSWAIRVRQDIMAAPLAREVQRQANLLDEILADLSTTEDAGALRDEEFERLRINLERLEQRLEEQIRKQARDQEEQEEKIRALREEVDALLTYARHADRRSSVRTVLGRLFRWGAAPENRDILVNATSIARNLLTGESGDADK